MVVARLAPLARRVDGGVSCAYLLVDAHQIGELHVVEVEQLLARLRASDSVVLDLGAVLLECGYLS